MRSTRMNPAVKLFAGVIAAALLAVFVAVIAFLFTSAPSVRSMDRGAYTFDIVAPATCRTV